MTDFIVVSIKEYEKLKERNKLLGELNKKYLKAIDTLNERHYSIRREVKK